ncbi:UDP-N-acetylmuramoyl-tripeptide--D-alanyl-D-alanine ligase [Nocardioides scoriae]|uniref:UDP-N-acetylmuramoyl-tripeptide--D-alanyl-D-alanine ligase n=1 Tax=Nocardioides scoriae TaxID=642780 RepID=A0A1H1L816_9ACTN|nr:UDP-N-acetylmuramoyl-tripeptide--D-alanyl-D-alanine ligase [Nocardioides scoriae]SDR70432.1 UDP-N-acetylmuramoyl-tripeptide--D-alanyl-D-alanine ligase [Nocardioides scoriae]
MIPRTLAQVADLVGGRLHDADPDLLVTGPAFLDSRSPEPGGLFVAFAGEHVDGHRFAAGAVEGGAAAVLGTRPTGVPTVVVDDAQVALQRLAQGVLRRRRRDDREAGRAPLEDPEALVVVAITGSQGKTSAKDMLARVLADAGPTVATAGSFNNELGLPLTVLRLTGETRFLVLEMGARGIGHLTELCAIAPPDVALVLNVGKAHLGEFGSQANIAQAKGEIVEALRPGYGVAVLNADDPLVTGMDARVTAEEGVEAVRFGAGADADVRVSGPVLDDLGRPSFDLLHAGASEHVDLRLLGAHQATNAAAAAAVGTAVGIPLDRVAASLRAIEALSRWRMELSERADGLVVVNDAYNANPDSMRSAVETLAGIGARSGRRTVAVLGEMRELGPTAVEEHRAVGSLTHELGVDEVVVVGPGAAGIAEARQDAGVSSSTHHVSGVDEATAWLRENVRGPDVVLVKASRSGGLERVARTLVDDPAPTDGAAGEEPHA